MGDNQTSPFVLDTPNPKLMFTPLDLPTTAELMQRCLAVNPFEAKFREANQKINSGSMQPNTSAANQSLEALEANGGLAPFCGANAGSMSDLLLKIPQSTLQQSPGIFSNIHLLAAAGDGSEGTTRENLKTADISKLLSVAGDISAQAPRTADVLNAVLDMHSDRLHTINYLNNKPDFSALLRSPSSSAPNSASILANAMSIPSTSGAGAVPPTGNLLAPPKTVSSYHSPSSTQKSPAQSHLEPVGNAWGTDRPDKQIKKEIPYFNDEAMMLMERNKWVYIQWIRIQQPIYSSMSSSGSEQDQAAGPSGNSSTSTGNPVGRPQNGTPGRGRGRGRSTTADMQPDERRNTILERNKAAAVRYRKRKKEEHDDMMGRVQAMEAEKNQLLVRRNPFEGDASYAKLGYSDAESGASAGAGEVNGSVDGEGVEVCVPQGNSDERRSGELSLLFWIILPFPFSTPIIAETECMAVRIWSTDSAQSTECIWNFPRWDDASPKILLLFLLSNPLNLMTFMCISCKCFASSSFSCFRLLNHLHLVILPWVPPISRHLLRTEIVKKHK